MKPPRKKKLITPLPREPLTAKARAAIQEFTLIEGKKKGNFVFVLITAVLKAECMKRVDLYALLEAKGYTWKSKSRAWLPNKPKNEEKPT